MSSLAGFTTIALLALLAPFAVGCAAGEGEGEAATADAITDDTTTIATTHSAVGTLMDGDTPRCTGTLISTNVVLTTAQCAGAAKLELALDHHGTIKRFAPMESGDARYPYAHVHPSFEAGHDLAFIVLSEAVPAHVAKPARIGSHANVDDCAFDVINYDGKTESACLTGTQPSTGLLTAKAGSACVEDSGGGLLLSGRATDVLVGVVGGGKRCGEMLVTPLASESAFVQQAFAAGARVRGTVAFD